MALMRFCDPFRLLFMLEITSDLQNKSFEGNIDLLEPQRIMVVIVKLFMDNNKISFLRKQF